MMVGPVLTLALTLLFQVVLSFESSPICKIADDENRPLKEDAGVEVKFELSCSNWNWEERHVLIALHPVNNLKVCVDGAGDSCKLETGDLLLNMTNGEQNYTVSLSSDYEGITCVKLSFLYMKGSQLLDPKTIELVTNEANSDQLERVSLSSEDIPDKYTHIFDVEVDAGTNLNRIGGSVEDRSEGVVVLADAGVIKDKYTSIQEDLALWQEVTLMFRAVENNFVARGSRFSRVLLLLGMASANWMVGTGISWTSLIALKEDLASMYRQCSCLNRIFRVQAWKVGLFCQVFYLPIISFSLAKLIFVEDHDNCKRVNDLSRLGLFMLGTAPGNTGSIYLSTLWKGNLELSVALVILSTLLSPLTFLLWWSTLGKSLNFQDGAPTALAIPIGSIVEFVSIMIVPIFFGMYIGTKFPSVKKLMEQIRNAVIVVGLLSMLVIFYFQYRHFFQFLGTNQLLSSALLAAISSSLAGLTAYLFKLNRGEVTSIAIDSCMQNATLAYAVVNGNLDLPASIYAEIPANAQILFTTAPIAVAWLMWGLVKKLQQSLRKRRRVVDHLEERPAVQSVVEEKEEVPMIRVSNIKEAWTNQDSGVSNGVCADGKFVLLL